MQGWPTRLTRGWLARAPKWLIITPLTVQWAALAWRYRSAMLVTAANPSLTSGGLVGESKLEYWQISGPLARQYWAPLTVLAAGQHAQWAMRMQQAGLDWPIMVKPARGLCGYGVRRLDDAGAMRDYLARYPAEEDLILQPFVALAGEAGLFYWHHPDQAAGSLTGIALRQPPMVTGNGRDSLQQLAIKAGHYHRLTAADHQSALDWQRVPACGELVRLAVIGSSRIGGVYRDGGGLWTPALEMAVQQIAGDMCHFQFGRFDVRYADEAALQRGDFVIIEVNGAGSEAIQAWDPDWPVWRALQAIFIKQRAAFEIGDAMRQRGHEPDSLWRVLWLNIRQQRLLARYPPSG